MFKPAILVLADGTVLKGISIGAEGSCVGELVFNTAMTGYQEMLTDPSYAKQIITLTSAHVGNTGCNLEDMESSRVWASGLVMRECSLQASNYRSQQSFPDWLKKHNLVAIAGIDTRELTLRLRDEGVLAACISTDPSDLKAALAKARSFSGLAGADLACEVSRQTMERWDSDRGIWGTSKPSQYHVVAYDFGIKYTILQILYEKGCHITIVPAKTSATDVLAMNPDGVILSNGPGDPNACDYAITATQALVTAGVPILGICLGFQIIALALGAHSLKMKFGHHGANHPVIKADELEAVVNNQVQPFLQSGSSASRAKNLSQSLNSADQVETVSKLQKVLVTSQNHGFAIDEASLPDCLQVTYRSLFDNSLQGIQHKHKPVLGFQGHPEGSPGPHDIELVFDQFISMMEQINNKEKNVE